MTHESLVRAYLRAVEQFDVEAMSQCLDPEIVVIELPNRVNPRGSRRDLPALRAGLPKGRQILREQHYLIEDVLEAGDRLVLQGRWEGVLAIPLGRLVAGDTLTADICMHFRCRQGRIVEQRTYDCYEDFSAAA